MKKLFLCVFTIAFLNSCSSESDGIDTATDSNLSEISSKLENLKIDKIQEQSSSSSEIELSSDYNFSRASIAQARTNQSEDFITGCNHQESFTDTYDGETFEVTIKYFDQDGNSTTWCDIEDNTTYTTEETTKITGTNYIYDWFATTTHEQSSKISDTSVSIDLKADSDLTGTLNFDGDIFNIVEGSYINLTVAVAYYFTQDFSDDEIYDTTVDLLYKMEFDTNGETYHFDMSIKEENFTELDDSFESEYILYNSSDKKIGKVKYVYNSDSEQEYFEVYDLNGHKV